MPVSLLRCISCPQKPYVANNRQYEIGRHMPPPVVRAYLKVIDAEPEIAARALAGV